MFSAKISLTIIAVLILISLLLAACGGNVVSDPSKAGVPSPASAKSATSAPQATSQKSGNSSAPSNGLNPGEAITSVPIEPCALFTQADFLAVFKKEAQAPDKWEGVCDFEFAQPLVPNSNEAFGLSIRVEKEAYTLDKFEKRAQLLRAQKVEGLGDTAYLQPSQAEDQSTDLFILKGKNSISLELLEPASVTATQRFDQLKAASQKVLAHLASYNPSGEGNSPAQSTTPADAASKSQPGPTALAGQNNSKPVRYDPCKLFGSGDFRAILSEEPQPAEKAEDVAHYSCSYDSTTSGDNLALYVQKENYTRLSFEAEWKDRPYTKTEAVSSLGDEAFWTEGPVSRLYVLKGSLAFWFELSLENDATAKQKLDILKRGAIKVLGQL